MNGKSPNRLTATKALLCLMLGVVAASYFTADAAGGNGALPTLGAAQKFDSAATANTIVLRDSNAGVTNGPTSCTQFTCSGSVNVQWNPQSASYAVVYGAGGDHVVYVDTTGGSRTITLPAPATVGAGYHLRLIKKVSANNMVIAPNAAETINGAASKTISAQYAIVELYCDGTNWIAGQLTVL